MIKVHRNSRKWIGSCIVTHKIKFTLSIFCSIFRSLLLIVPTILIKYIINEIIPRGDVKALLFANAINILIYVIISILIILDLGLGKYILDAFAKLRVDMYSDLLSRKISSFSQILTGDTISRIVDETEGLANFYYFGLGNFVWINTTIIAGIVFMFLQDIILALLTILVIMCRLYTTHKLATKQKQIGGRKNANNSSLNQVIKDEITNVLIIKANGCEERELQKVNSILEKKYHIQHIENKHLTFCNAILALYEILINAIFYLYGISRVCNGELMIGTLVAFVGIYEWILPAVNGYVDLYQSFVQKFDSIERVFTFFTGQQIKEQGISCENHTIETRNLSFGYKDNMIINGLNLAFDEKKKYGIFGESGTGKSTLASILAGLEDGYEGEVLLGGKDIREFDANWLHKNIILVGQDGHLENTTIRENIIFHLSEVSSVDYDRVLRIVKLDRWINTLPEKSDTRVGENSSWISGGERQRILLARALLRNADIYIFDESTSALDYNTEYEIVESINKYYKKSTLIFITHRKNVIELLDQSVDLSKTNS